MLSVYSSCGQKSLRSSSVISASFFSLSPLPPSLAAIIASAVGLNKTFCMEKQQQQKKSLARLCRLVKTKIAWFSNAQLPKCEGMFAVGFIQAATEGTHREVWFTSFLQTTEVSLRRPLPPWSVTPLLLLPDGSAYLTSALTNPGNPYAWCVTTELSVSAAHAPAYLQQAIMVYQFTVSVLTPVQLAYCTGS